MLESKAWRVVAEEYDAGRTWSEFLCWSIDDPRGNERLIAIPREVSGRMRDRIYDAVGGDGPAYVTGNREECSNPRVLACLMFAQQAKDEERAAERRWPFNA